MTRGARNKTPQILFIKRNQIQQGGQIAIFANFLESMRIVFAVLCLLLAGTAQGQTYEVGLFGGGANNIGDVGRMN